MATVLQDCDKIQDMDGKEQGMGFWTAHVLAG